MPVRGMKSESSTNIIYINTGSVTIYKEHDILTVSMPRKEQQAGYFLLTLH